MWEFSSFLLTGRMGNNKQALQLIIQEENDVEKVTCSVALLVSSSQSILNSYEMR